MIPKHERQRFFDDLADGEPLCLTAMTRLEWAEREAVDYALWHLSEGAPVREIAEYLRVTTSIVYRWRKKAGESELWDMYDN